ncbi:Cullin-3B [Cardamine amara subsp. amara]|uniref:Cullin-3B n=1 Tax=Cardamine amara subsp. amara TaxID=228776 RepID=A0ABD1B3U9_CARAN
MGTADIKAVFGKNQKHELNVSTFQMCVLMLFNNSDRLSYKEIEQATEIPASDLKRCLQSMACVKGKNVLRKEPMSKDIAEEDSFVVNERFTSKFYKVKIGTVAAQKETEPEKQETRQRVKEDRKPQIEAAIMRIMKSRRVLDHNNIITEVTKQLQSRFLANPTEIKKRIESLIERDFLERDSTDRKLYRYLA